MSGEGKIKGLFESFLSRAPIFKNKKVLQSTYNPVNIQHRQKQITQIAEILGPALRLERPSNIFIYGKTGTGKTCSVKYTTANIMEVAKQNKIVMRVVYLNCKLKRVADTEYRLIAQIAREFGEEIPATGLPTDEVYRIFLTAVDSREQILLLVLDEIDQLMKKTGDEILYTLTRINSDLKKAQICLIGISNDLVFADSLDPRVRSSLSEEEIVFPPYNALQIQDILNHRVSIAFQSQVLETGVIEKCSALAAREHGDARRALELLRVSGELAEREGCVKVQISHIDHAENKIEKDRFIDIVKTHPKQFQVVLFSILSVNTGKNIFTGDIYNTYKECCSKIGLRPLTQRRVSDIVAELDMLGLINAKVISKGRYGRTREIGISIPPSTEPKIKDLLKKELEL